MIEAMDDTVNPCDDFYEFACGGWIRSYVLPEDKSWNSILFEVGDRVEIKVKGWYSLFFSKNRDYNITRRYIISILL